MATVSTSNYTIGAVDLFFNASVAHASLLATLGSGSYPGKGGQFRSAANNIGNIVTSEIAPDVTYIEHFICDKGMKKKDKVVAGMTSMTIPFTFDEVNEANLKRFFMASTLASGRIAPYEKTLVEGSAQLYFSTDIGNDFTYFIPKCTLKPNGSVSINTEDWWTMPLVLEVLFYDTDQWASKPYGMIFASNL